MTRWDDLLAVQEHDTTIDQLVHRRAHLAEPRRARRGHGRAGRRSRPSAAEVEETRHGLGRDQQRLEDEITSLNDRANHHDKTLYSGTIGNPRELQSLQDEIASLKRRISQLEDQELEVMEQIEPLDAQLAAFAASRAALDERGSALRAQIAEEEVAIDAELEQVRGERDALAGTVDAELLAEYDELRKRSGGIAIARLVGGSCGGCHLSLSAVDVDRIKKLAARGARALRGVRPPPRPLSAALVVLWFVGPVDPHRVGGLPQPVGRLPARRPRQRPPAGRAPDRRAAAPARPGRRGARARAS